METRRITAIVLLVGGIVLLIAGMNASDSFVDRSSNFFTGHYTDTTMWYLIGGVVSALIGGVMLFGRRA